MLSPIMRFKKRPEVEADMFIPARRFLDFCKLYEQDFGFYPLWIVPYRVPDAYPWLNPEHFARMADDLLIDCAVYGMKDNGESDDPPQWASARRKAAVQGINDDLDFAAEGRPSDRRRSRRRRTV